MAKDTKKTKTKAKINWGWDSPANRDGKATRSTKKNEIPITDDYSIKIKRKPGRKKKLGFSGILTIILVAILGAGVGAGACYYLGRNDCFELIGQEELTLTLPIDGKTADENNCYIDQGVKIISFGRDISNEVIIETDLKKNEDGSFTADEIGTYYIKYTVDDIKYGKIFTIQRIRLITFVEAEEPDINVDGEQIQEEV